MDNGVAVVCGLAVAEACSRTPACLSQPLPHTLDRYGFFRSSRLRSTSLEQQDYPGFYLECSPSPNILPDRKDMRRMGQRHML